MPEDGFPRQRRGVLLPIALGVCALVGLYAARQYNYLLFHSLAEMFSIIVGCGIFLIAWNARPYILNGYLHLLGVAFLFVAILDLVHTLAYSGMPVFPGYGTNLPTQLWIGARSLEALSLLAAPLFLGRRLNVHAAALGYTLIVALFLGSVFVGPVFPACFVEGTGLTAFKVGSEYAICAVLLGAGVLLYRHRSAFDRPVLYLVEASIGATALSEFLFTRYTDPTGPANMAGHFIKIVAFYLIYKAIIETGLVRPYGLLFRELKQSEDALREARDGLEVRVRERTAELESEAAVRRQAQEALRRSEERFRLLAQNAHDIIFRCRTRPRLAFDYLSPAISTIMGYGPEEFYADPDLVLRIAHPDDRAALQRQLADPESAPGPFTIRWQRRDGRPVWTEQTMVPVRDAVGVMVAVEGIARDITERKKDERLILAYQRQLRSLASELLLAEERERRRIAADLHDGVCQMLAAARIKLGALSAAVPQGLPQATLGEVRDLVDQSIRDTRSLTFEISPPVLYEIGLEAAIDWLAEQMRERYGIRTEFVNEGGGPRPFDEDVRVLLFRAVRELLINVAKHARAERATVSVRNVDGGVQITVEDDGRGFEVGKLKRPTPGGGGFGLFNIRERLEHLSGQVTIESRPGHGTRVVLTAPLKQATSEREAVHDDQGLVG